MPGGRRQDVGAARCSICGISFPPYMQVCRGCDEELDFISNAKPDPDWGSASAEIRSLRDADDVPEEKMRKQDDDGITRVHGRVQVEDGQYFISIEDVVGSGYYEPLDTFDIVQVGKHFFEVIGMWSQQKAYLVRYFSMGIDDADMAWLAHGGDAAA